MRFVKNMPKSAVVSCTRSKQVSGISLTLILLVFYELRRNDEFMAALRHDQDFLRDCERDEPLMTGPCGPQGEPPLPPGIPLPKVRLKGCLV